MKGPAPDSSRFQGEKRRNPCQHLARSSVCKGKQQDRLGFDSVVQEPGDSVDKGPRFSASSARQNQGWTRFGSNSGVLLIIQPGAIIDAARCLGRDFLELIFTRHAAGQPDRFCFSRILARSLNTRKLENSIFPNVPYPQPKTVSDADPTCAYVSAWVRSEIGPYRSDKKGYLALPQIISQAALPQPSPVPTDHATSGSC